MNIVLPPALEKFVQERISAAGYENVSEYIRELIRNDQKQQAKSVLEAEVLRGIASGPARKMTPRDWKALHNRVGKRAKQAKRA